MILLHDFGPSERKARYTVCSRVAKDYGLDVDYVQASYNQINRMTIQQWEHEGHCTTRTIQAYREAVWQDTLKLLDISFDSCLIRTLSSEYEEERIKHLRLFDDVIECLEYLTARYPLGLISNGFVDSQRRQTELLGIEKYFKVMLFEGELGFGKPDKRMFVTACDYLESGPDNTVMIGDSLNKDIKGATDIGCLTIWLNRRDAPLSGDAKPHFVAKSLTEIPGILDTLSL